MMQRVLDWLRCWCIGHLWSAIRHRVGYMTCVRCGRVEYWGTR